MSWWKFVIAALIVLAVGAMTVGGLRQRPLPAAEVQLTHVRKGPISRIITGAGKVAAATTVKISSNLSGDLLELPVNVGDQVRLGQVLGRTTGAEASMNRPRPTEAEGDGHHSGRRRWLGRRSSGRGWSKGLARGRTRQGSLDLASARPGRPPSRSGCPALAALDEAEQLLEDDPDVAHRGRHRGAAVGERVRGATGEDVVMTLPPSTRWRSRSRWVSTRWCTCAISNGPTSNRRLGQTFEGTAVESSEGADPNQDRAGNDLPVTVAWWPSPTAYSRA
jgi:HlyD family secretion protein